MKKESLAKRYGIALSYIAVSVVSLLIFWALSLTGVGAFVGIFNAYKLIFPLIVSISVAPGIGF
ncbi:MAG: hypothetical protein NDN66_10065, partial [Carnobacterium sp.]|uniref:hypothetical protein n=1 Tax=Carnobacterium sp. TaxID=48221 RepID=UPI002958534C